MNAKNTLLENIKETRKIILALPESVERAKLLIENDNSLIYVVSHHAIYDKPSVSETES